MINLQTIKWLDKEEIDKSLGVLFDLYPQDTSKQDNVDSFTIIKPEIIDYILNLRAINYKNDVLSNAAAIAKTIIKGHPLLDGNKRFGMLLSERFLEINRYIIRTSQRDYKNAAINLANSSWDKKEFLQWLKRVAKKKTTI